MKRFLYSLLLPLSILCSCIYEDEPNCCCPMKVRVEMTVRPDPMMTVTRAADEYAIRDLNFYLCDDNGDFVDHCYKLKVLNKQGASSELKEEKFAVALPAGDTLIVLTGGTQPQMPCYQIVTFENTFALQYLDEKMSDTLKLLDGVNVVFDDQFVTKVDVANNTLNTMQISSGGDNLKVKNTVSIQEDNASEGYCSIGASGNLTVVELSAAKVESMIGISGVELKLLLTSEQMEELKNMIG